MPAPCPAAAPCRRWPWNRRPGCDALAPTHTHAPTETHSDAHTRWRTPRRRAALSKALTVTARRWEVVVAPGEADRLAPMVQSLSRRYLGPDFSNREVDDDKRPKGELPAAGPRRGWRCVCVGACVSVGGVRGLHVHRGKMAPPSVLPATCLAGSPCHATPRTPPWLACLRHAHHHHHHQLQQHVAFLLLQPPTSPGWPASPSRCAWQPCMMRCTKSTTSSTTGGCSLDCSSRFVWGWAWWGAVCVFVCVGGKGGLCDRRWQLPHGHPR